MSQFMFVGDLEFKNGPFMMVNHKQNIFHNSDKLQQRILQNHRSFLQFQLLINEYLHHRWYQKTFNIVRKIGISCEV